MPKLKKPCKDCPFLKSVTTKMNTWENSVKSFDENGLTQMSCHKSNNDKHCAGWVISQLKNGISNIGLRISILNGLNTKEFDTNTDVYESLEDAIKNSV
jgi:Family of unknown function (DUF6283)